MDLSVVVVRVNQSGSVECVSGIKLEQYAVFKCLCYYDNSSSYLQ